MDKKIKKHFTELQKILVEITADRPYGWSRTEEYSKVLKLSQQLREIEDKMLEYDKIYDAKQKERVRSRG